MMVPRSEYYKPYSYWKVKMPAVKLIPRSDSRQIEEIAVAEPDLFCKTKEPRRLYDRHSLSPVLGPAREFMGGLHERPLAGELPAFLT
jgi:hypothetical protein